MSAVKLDTLTDEQVVALELEFEALIRRITGRKEVKVMIGSDEAE